MGLTMERYIGAERFKLWLQENYVLYDGDRYFNDIDAQPTADVRENVHAHWIKHKDRECWYCSSCNADDYYAYYWSDTGGLELQDRFCPNCGSQMDERIEECEKQQ